jgi:hypothetical protein
MNMGYGLKYRYTVTIHVSLFSGAVNFLVELKASEQCRCSGYI